MTIKRVKAPFAIGAEGGAHRVYVAGDLVDTSDSAYQGREHLFEDLNLAVDRKAEPQTSATHKTNVERATADPEEKREVRPWLPLKKDAKRDDATKRDDAAKRDETPDKDDDQNG